MGASKVDGSCLKKGVWYCCKQNQMKPVKEFQKALKNVIEHHFGCHDNWGDWRPAKGKDQKELEADC